MKSLFDKRKLKYAASLNDESLTESTDPDFELQYVDIGNVDSQGNIHELAVYPFKKAPSRARRQVKHGDVIISTVRTYLQAIAPIKEPEANLIVSTGFAVVRPNSNILSDDYFKYAVRESRFLEEVEARSKGVSYPAINSSELADIAISLPTIEIQQLIADYLDRETTQIDNLIATKEQMLTLLEEKREALINHIFTRGLDTNTDLKPSGIAWLGKIPKSWEVRRGKYLFSQSSLPVRETDEIVTCFRDGQVTLRKNRREDGFTNAVLELGYQGIRKGQLVLHSMDAFAGSIGISDSDGKCSPEYIICDPLCDGIDSQYYALLLRVMALRGFIQAACTAVRERAPRIRFSHLANMFLPLPPISEQQAIVQTIEQEKDSTKDLVIALTDSIALLKERRSALITAAVTGQISIQEMSKHSQNEVSQ